MKIDFEWNDDESAYIAEVSGFQVHAIRDDDARNPWEDMDGLAPLMSYTDRTLTENGDWPDIIAAMSDSFIARNWRELCNIAGMAPDDAKRHKDDGTYFRIADAKRDLLDDWLRELKPGKYGGAAGEYMRAMESLFSLKGWPVIRTTSSGYCQGDYAELLLAWTPDFAEVIGRDMPRSAKQRKAVESELESEAKLWGAWAWGDVYGYVIKTESGEVGDSCWGFYGTDFDESGLSEAAASTIDYMRQNRKERRTARLKELIRARVPAAIRADILKGFPL